ETFDAVVDVAERPGLLTVSPHLDRPAVLGERNLAAHRGRRLLASAVVGAVGAVDVVEANDTSLHAVLGGVVLAELLAEHLLPAVGVLRRRRVRVFLAEAG